MDEIAERLKTEFPVEPTLLMMDLLRQVSRAELTLRIRSAF